MVVESYPSENSKLVPRLLIKRWLEKSNSVRSFGDFQIRGLKDLSGGFGTQWITRDQLQATLDLLKRDNIKAYIDSHKNSTVSEDLVIAEKMNSILLKKEPLTPADFAMIRELILKIIRLDDGSGSNIVGKIVGASLANFKINTHFQTLNGILGATNDPIYGFQNDPEKMKRYENMIYVINNMGEQQALMGSTENLLYRIFDGMNHQP